MERCLGDATEPLLQSVAIPLAFFAADGLRPNGLESIELQFDNTDAGVLIIERIGIWVPDARCPGFAAECRRQSQLLHEDHNETEWSDRLPEGRLRGVD